MRSLRPCSDSSATPSFPSPLSGWAALGPPQGLRAPFRGQQGWIVFVVLICIHSPCLTLGIQCQRRSRRVACVFVSVRRAVCSWRRSSSCCALPQARPLPRSKRSVKHVFTIFMCLHVVGPKPEPAPWTSLECSCIRRLTSGANLRARSGVQSSTQKSCCPRSASQLVTQEMVPHLGGSLRPF